MSTIRVGQVREGAAAQPARAAVELETALLAAGILSSLLYAAMLVVVPLQDAGYNSASRTVSELSAVGAPTRSLWVGMGLVWSLLYAAFGWGVWRSAGGSRRLRVVGAVIVAATFFGLFWPPMHRREVLAAGGGTLTNTLHIVWTAVNGALTLLAMGIGAAALGARFRLYSIATMVVVIAAGAGTATYASRMAANLPTPWIGVWERLNIGAWLLWVLVLAVALLRLRRNGRAPGERPAARATASTRGAGSGLRPWLLACGLMGAVLYPLANIVAARRYPGFSHRDQAVSELFAIGAPTSPLVVPLFTVSGTLLLIFAVGIWMSGHDRRYVRLLALMMGPNALDALVI